MVLGVLILGIGGTTLLPEWGSLVAFVLGVIALFTGIRQFCPIRKWLGINTYDHHPTENHYRVNIITLGKRSLPKVMMLTLS